MESGYLGISNYHERGLTPNGYDLRISEISVRGDPDVKKEGTVRIPPRTMFYVSTVGRVKIPKDCCAQLWMRTTWIRRAAWGIRKDRRRFRRYTYLGAYNASDDVVEIPIGERILSDDIRNLTTASDKGTIHRGADIIRDRPESH